MPRRKKNTSQNKNKFKKDFKSIFLDLSYVEEAEFLQRYENELWSDYAAVTTLLDLGWKVSLSHSFDQDCFYCSGTYRGVDHDGLADLTFVSRHEDLEKSFGLLNYYIQIMIEERGVLPVDNVPTAYW